MPAASSGVSRTPATVKAPSRILLIRDIAVTLRNYKNQPNAAVRASRRTHQSCQRGVESDSPLPELLSQVAGECQSAGKYTLCFIDVKVREDKGVRHIGRE